MNGKRLLWVDVGMAVMAVGFIAIVVFLRDAAFFVGLALAYAVAVAVWAFIAEVVSVKAEEAERKLLWEPEPAVARTDELAPY